MTDAELQRAEALGHPELTPRVLAALQKSLSQGLRDIEDAVEGQAPASAGRAQALVNAYNWGLHGFSREVMALALEAVNARLGAAGQSGSGAALPPCITTPPHSN